MNLVTFVKEKSLIVGVFLFFVCLLFAFYPESVDAAKIPTIRGYVYTETRRPIPGVWVAMTSSGCPACPQCIQDKATRYAKTNDKGEFVFEPVYIRDYLQPGGKCESNPAIGRRIDTDLDGVLDAEEIPSAPAGCKDGGARACTYDFGCWGVTYTFSVVKPFNWTGSFSQLEGIDFNNAHIDFTIRPGEIIYNPNVPTPTPTIAVEYPSQEPPFPSCLTSTVLQFGSGEICRVEQGGCKTHEEYTFSSLGGNATLKIYTGMGHFWDQGCNQGAGNDPQRSGDKGPCDQTSQTYEAVVLMLNGVEVGRTTDLGTDLNSYWEFPVSLNNGTNTLAIKHIIAGENLSIESESVFYKGAICAEASAPFEPSSCKVSLPPTISLTVGETKQLLPLIEAQNGTVDKVKFRLEPLGIASLCSSELARCNAGRYLYESSSTANITGISNGDVKLTVSASMDDEGVNCAPDTSIVQVSSPNSWLQVRGGGVTVGGNVSLEIPQECGRRASCSPYFIKESENSDIGALITKGFFNSSSNVSSKKWLASGGINSLDQFSCKKISDQIWRQVNVSTNNLTQSVLRTGGFEQDGYYYYFYDGSRGDLTIADDVSLGARRVVLAVRNASVNINGNLSLTDGLGFFMLITDKDIIVSKDVGLGLPDGTFALEGIYCADGSFITKSSGTEQDGQLSIRGSVFAKKFVLSRSLENNSLAPAEVVEFAPDLYLLFPRELLSRSLYWREVDP